MGRNARTCPPAASLPHTWMWCTVPARYAGLPYRKAVKLETPVTIAWLEALFPSDVITRVKQAAEIEGKTVSDFVVAVTDKAARSVIQGAETFRSAIEMDRQMTEGVLNASRGIPTPKPGAKQKHGLFKVE